LFLQHPLAAWIARLDRQAPSRLGHSRSTAHTSSSMMRIPRRRILAVACPRGVLMSTRLIPLLAICAFPGLAAAADVSFARHVRPLLAEHCFACHGPDAKTRKARLRLDTREGLSAAAKDVLARVTSADPAKRMPPAKAGKTLGPAQVE